jgi:alpha-tubulin suppressor-like RCC1 family protein
MYSSMIFIIKMIFCGWSHNIILNEKNELFVCGDNSKGQLGLGDNENINEYIRLDYNFGKIKNIFCGSFHNIILNENNELFVCGDNEYGQLGLGDNENRNTYEKLEHNFGIIKNIICSFYYNIILNENNELYVCGGNRLCELGLGDNINRNKYFKLEHNFGKIKNIYHGYHHNIILNDDNELYVCGYNIFGQLGLGDTQNRNTYVKLTHKFGIIKNIFCGFDYNIILNENNELYVCGNNYYGQLGFGDKEDRKTYYNLKHNLGKIKNIFCGSNHNIILNENNDIYVCGNNVNGQLGLGDNIDRNVYVRLENNFGFIKDIFCGRSHNIILNEKNEIYVCGYNYGGQLGLGDNENRNLHEKLNQNMLEYIPNIINNTILLDTNMIIEL